MKHRTWITEALRLHFEEHLPRVVAGRRLGVPKSTVCSMFVRFRRAGLSWPLPAGMSEQELDACLYGQFSTVPVVRPESTVISEAPVVKKRPRRPNFPYEFKIALVEQSLQPGACVAQIARENGINDNLLFNWRHQYRKGGLLPSGKNMPALLPVTLTPEPDNKIPVSKLDRLGRNAMDIRKTVEQLTESGIRVHCLALGGVDLTSPAGKMTMQVISAVAEFERDLLLVNDG